MSISIPFKKKMSYAWERAAHKDRIYSHVFEKRGTAGVIGMDKEINTKDYLWLRATKIESSPDTFKLDLCHQHTFARPNWESVKSQRSYEELSWHGVYTREQVKALIKNWEADSLKDENTFLAPEQPFKGYIKTKLATPK